MKNKPVIITLIICILIAAAGLAYRFAVSAQQGPSGNREAMKELFEKKQKIVIDCLGDSITWGMYSSPRLIESIENGEVQPGLDDGGQLFEDYDIYISSAYQSAPSYPEMLERELNRRLEEDGLSNKVQTVNDGICGDWITETTYRRMSCDPDIVILLMGGNNFYFHYPIAGMFETNVEALKAQGKILYLANYPLFPGEKHVTAFRDANEHIEKIAKQYDLPVIDLYSFYQKIQTEENIAWRDLFSPDHIHLSETGYERIGSYIAESLYADLR